MAQEEIGLETKTARGNQRCIKGDFYPFYVFRNSYLHKNMHLYKHPRSMDIFTALGYSRTLNLARICFEPLCPSQRQNFEEFGNCSLEGLQENLVEPGVIVS